MRATDLTVQWIRIAREVRGYTQQDLADMVEMSQPAISLIERGKTRGQLTRGRGPWCGPTRSAARSMPTTCGAGCSTAPPDRSGSGGSASTPSATPVRRCCSPGKDVKQVQEWLGHADPGFTLRTYVHLMDEGLGSADFLDDVVASRPQAMADSP